MGRAVALLLDLITTPATVSNTDYALDTTSQTTYTFTAKAIGTAATGRLIVVAAHSLSSVGQASSCTIAGGAATNVATTIDSLSTVTLFSAVVNTGTTADITITYGAAGARCAIGVWAINNLISTTATTATSIASPPSSALTIQAGGVAIGAATFRYDTGNATVTWTNLTESYDNIGENTNETYSGACIASAGGQSSTITATPTGSIEEALVLAAWR